MGLPDSHSALSAASGEFRTDVHPGQAAGRQPLAMQAHPTWRTIFRNLRRTAGAVGRSASRVRNIARAESSSPVRVSPVREWARNHEGIDQMNVKIEYCGA